MNQSRMLVFGCAGMLGTALVALGHERGADVTGYGHADVDVSDVRAVASAVERFAEGGDGIVLNAAAYNDVERAESEVGRAFAVNGEGPAGMASAAREHGLRFVHVSTDYVFDGEHTIPYVEEDAPNPLSAYGRSKLEGERGVAAAYPEALVVRTSWVFGEDGNCFPAKVLARARQGAEMRMVRDETSRPTYATHLAEGILGLSDAGAEGLFHLAGSGWCSRFDFAEEILRQAGIHVTLRPVSASEFPTVAGRPTWSVLDCGKAEGLGVALPIWQEGVAAYLAGMGVIGRPEAAETS